MTAGSNSVPIVLGNNANAVALMWSSDGTLGGNLQPMPISPDLGFKIDTAWDGVSGTVSLISIAKTLTGLATANTPVWTEGYHYGPSFDLHGSTRTTILDKNGNAVVFTPNAATNGLTRHTIVSAASTNLLNVKNTAGNIYEIDIFNTATYTIELQLFDKATAPIIGTDTPIWTIPLQTLTGFAREFAFGEYFATGISMAITKGDGTTAVAAGDMVGKFNWI